MNKEITIIKGEPVYNWEEVLDKNGKIIGYKQKPVSTDNTTK